MSRTIERVEVWEEFEQVGGVVRDDPGGYPVVGAEREQRLCQFGFCRGEVGRAGEHFPDAGEEARKETWLVDGAFETEGEVRFLEGWRGGRPLGAVDEAGVEDFAVHVGDGYGVVLASIFWERAGVGWLGGVCEEEGEDFFVEDGW